MIIASACALIAGTKWMPKASFELPVVWEQKISARSLIGFELPCAGCLPAVGEDRSVYLGCRDGTLYAFTGSGLPGWKFNTNQPNPRRDFDSGVMGITIDSGGTIYAAADGLFAFTSDGVVKWHLKLGSISAPALGAGDRVYVLGKNLYAISTEGAIEWELNIAGDWSGYWRDRAAGPLVGSDGTVFVGGCTDDEKRNRHCGLHAISPDGSIKWIFEAGYLSSPVPDEQGTIYFVSGGALRAVNKKGELKWIYKTPGLWSTSTPAVSVDHVVYFGVDSYLFAVGPEGKFKWRFETGDKVRSSPAIDAKGNIWFGSNDGRLYCVDKLGSLVGAWPFEGSRSGTPLIARHGTIYLHDIEGIRVLRGPNEPASGAWPMERHDVQNTGRF